MSNFIHDLMIELDAYGVIFHPIGQYPWHEKCKVHCEYDKKSILEETLFPRSDASFYKLENNKRIWFIERCGKYFEKNDYEGLINAWHNSDCGCKIYEFLGITLEEYLKWVNKNE